MYSKAFAIPQMKKSVFIPFSLWVKCIAHIN